MRKGLFLSLSCFVLLMTTACGPKQHPTGSNLTLDYGQTQVSFETSKHLPKIGNLVAFYDKASHLTRPYRIIGHQKVSRYTILGLERPHEAIHEIMKRLAASMGGDAVVNIKTNHRQVEGTVISFEKVLL